MGSWLLSILIMGFEEPLQKGLGLQPKPYKQLVGFNYTLDNTDFEITDRLWSVG